MTDRHGYGAKKSGAAPKKREKTSYVVISIVLLLVFSAIVTGALYGLNFLRDARASANAMKEDARQVLSCVFDRDTDKLDYWIAQFDQDAKTLNELMDSPLGRLASKVPGLRTEMSSANLLIEIASETSETLLKPFAALQKSYPLASLKNDDGYDVRILNAYLDFTEEKIPAVEKLVDSLGKVELGVFDRAGKLEEYRAKMGGLVDAYRSYEKYLPLLRAFLGNGEDKLYFFAAQNSSEIRSSGGFPGSVGTIRIRDGVLRIGKFGTVTGVIAFNNSTANAPTHTEVVLSRGWMENGPRDADFSPDFERVAEIWARAYGEQNGETPDGVISATPAIIQRLLGVLGGIELSDGTALDGSNAVRVLEYDLYYRYLGAHDNMTEGNRITDGLFSETVEKLMEKLVFKGSVSQARDLVAVLEQSAADRTLMLWFADENKQQLVRDLGVSASLNRDPSRPEAGVYFSLADPGRMGWFLNMDAEAVELETREDGSMSYEISVTLTNVMTQEELEAASPYIKGVNHPGRVYGFLYLFAPKDGTIGKVSDSNSSILFSSAEYRGLELAYTHSINLAPGESVSFRYVVTTAPGEQEPLSFSMTPTLQNFR